MTEILWSIFSMTLFRHKAVLEVAIIDALTKLILQFVFRKWKKSLVTHSPSEADTNTSFWCFIRRVSYRVRLLRVFSRWDLKISQAKDCATSLSNLLHHLAVLLEIIFFFLTIRWNLSIKIVQVKTKPRT